MEEKNPEIDTIPQEPTLTAGREATHEEGSMQKRNEGVEEKEMEVADRTSIDQVENIPHSPFQATMQREVRRNYSPCFLTKKIVVPAILKFVSSKEGATIVGSSLADS